jgi:hypothetical protein
MRRFDYSKMICREIQSGKFKTVEDVEKRMEKLEKYFDKKMKNETDLLSRVRFFSDRECSKLSLFFFKMRMMELEEEK